MDLDLVRKLLKSSSLSRVSQATGVSTKVLRKLREVPGYDPRYSAGVALVTFFRQQLEGGRG